MKRIENIVINDYFFDIEVKMLNRYLTVAMRFKIKRMNLFGCLLLKNTSIIIEFCVLLNLTPIIIPKIVWLQNIYFEKQIIS